MGVNPVIKTLRCEEPHDARHAVHQLILIVNSTPREKPRRVDTDRLTAQFVSCKAFSSSDVLNEEYQERAPD